MRNRKPWVSAVAALMAFVITFGLVAGTAPTAVSAKTMGELQQEINSLKGDLEAANDKIAEIEGKLSQNMTEMSQIVEQKNLIDQQVFVLHEKVNNINAQITAYNELIADKQDELDEAQARLAELNKKNKERIRTMEENGKLSYWSVLFKANSFADLLDRLNMVEEIAASDQRRLKEMSEAAEAVANAKAALETEKAGLEATKVELDASQKDLQAKREEADKLLNELIAFDEEYQAYLDEAGHVSAELQSQIDAAQKEYNEMKEEERRKELERIEAANKQHAAAGGNAGVGNTVDGLTWLVPVSYNRFSSPFGYRVHPVYGDWRFHSGVDLSAPSGTPIYATRAGKVAIATYDSSAGYYVNINHMDGFTSRYMHMTHYIVSAGDYVAAGQVIGYVGSTGTSTGPHLHFGIYYNGTAVNPANYINI